jgi:SAM-dependent methyltransferase
MPYQESIDYQTVDFMHTNFAAGSFQAITAISVIEHGFQSKPLLSEVSRLLRPGGYFVASFDYWPEKIDTTGFRLFGVSWQIFSEAEVAQFVSDAKGFGMEPVGGLKSEISERVIQFEGKNYTFAWVVLQKTL